MTRRRLGTSLLTLLARFGQPTGREVVAVLAAEIVGKQQAEAAELAAVESQLNQATGQSVVTDPHAPLKLEWPKPDPEPASELDRCAALSDIFYGLPCTLAEGHYPKKQHVWGALR